jgi:(heptosyl)LPS beta-1,4-glucosyltransferase
VSAAPVRLGGFVIHGDAASTLGPCLEALAATCDEVVAVDSGSRDGSAELARARGARRLERPWRGYGAARADAAAALRGCDYLFFLDSDEYLEPPAAEAIRRWKGAGPRSPHVRLVRRDWAELPGHRFLFRQERHVRLVRADAPLWEPCMVVHEALPRAAAADLDACIEHRFVSAPEVRQEKEDRYALLWALRARLEGRRAKPVFPQRLAHALRNALLKGAALRGGLDGLALAWRVSRYHAEKYRRLAEVERGEWGEELTALREGRLEELFARVARMELQR